MIAPAFLPLTCDRCKRFIAPGESYIVTPDVAGVGADVVSCRNCDPDFEGARAGCATCGEDLDNGGSVYHSSCMPDHVDCSKCFEPVEADRLKDLLCAKCTPAKAAE
ncbi:MAG TPA: hypothetical protein VEW95_09310 [Candidatus Limnocylindrales bacterium]|nr:hypothetical protein [Candidatus Limnocylindrales bacterium]